MSKSNKLSIARILLLVACIAVFLSCIRLGVWQLSRAEQKLQIKADVAKKSAQVISLGGRSVVLGDRFSQIEVFGAYLTDKTLFLDRQLLNGTPAYAVFTPFKVRESGAHILVNRGLIPAADDRGVLPIIETSGKAFKLKGRLNYPEPKPAFWRDSFPIEKNSVWQFLDIPVVSSVVGHELEPLVVELDKTLDQAGGYVRQWRPYDDQWVNRHRAYALQWFSMAAVFVFMCFFALRHRD